VIADEAFSGANRALLAAPNLAQYRCVQARVTSSADGVRTSAATLHALGLASGDEALVWIDDAH
jgi:arginine/ornithine N-succinyltransferase beta subunit